jgi:hypothetical protein
MFSSVTIVAFNAPFFVYTFDALTGAYSSACVLGNVAVISSCANHRSVPLSVAVSVAVRCDHQTSCSVSIGCSRGETEVCGVCEAPQAQETHP